MLCRNPDTSWFSSLAPGKSRHRKLARHRLLIMVGIIFTFARAHTGTVVASFLLHLGYNSMIAAATIVGTHGFTQTPTH